MPPGSDPLAERGAPARIKTGAYVLDDHELVRAGLRSVLRVAGIPCAGESGSAREAARRIPALLPAIAILDDLLPDGTGMDVCRSVRAVDPSIRCVIMTDGDSEAALIGAVTAGAWGCLSKEDDGAETVRLLRRILGGRTAFSPVFRTMLLRPAPRGSTADPRLLALSPQELRVLLLLGDGMSNREIAADLVLAEKTIKNMTSTVLRKLDLQHRTQAAMLIAGELARIAPTAWADRLGRPSATADAVTLALLDCVAESDGAGHAAENTREEGAHRLVLALQAARPDSHFRDR